VLYLSCCSSSLFATLQASTITDLNNTHEYYETINKENVRNSCIFLHTLICCQWIFYPWSLTVLCVEENFFFFSPSWKGFEKVNCHVSIVTRGCVFDGAWWINLIYKAIHVLALLLTTMSEINTKWVTFPKDTWCISPRHPKTEDAFLIDSWIAFINIK
jgi:hypothetical protein